MAPLGIKPMTFWLVMQCLNRCTIAYSTAHGVYKISKGTAAFLQSVETVKWEEN